MRSPKSLVKTWILRCGWIRQRYEWGYFGLPIGVLIRNFLFQRLLGINRTTKWSVHFSSQVIEPGKLRVGKNVARSFALSGGCYIQAGNGIEIGDDTIFAPGVAMVSANHNPDNLSHWQPEPPIRIGHHCWIGVNAVILPGVCLGDDVIVGAGSVVTHDFPNGCIIVGNPARVLRQR